MSVLVTVGTTEFDDLIKVIDTPQFISLLKSLNYSTVICQIGTGHHVPKLSNFRTAPSLIPFIQDSDLIISHGGAGTILECLRLNKKLIIVTNPKLMNNHQSELASELQTRGCLLLCESPSSLASALPLVNSFTPAPLPHSNSSEFLSNLSALLT